MKPRQIEIAGYPWKIISKDLSPRGILGETHPDSHKIYIHSKLKGEDYEKVLLHEIIHAVLAMNGYGTTSDNLLSPALEESLTTCLESHLHKIYQRRER